MYLGQKGVTWDTINGKDQLLPAIKDLLLKDKNAFRAKNLCGGELWTWFDPHSAAKREFAVMPPNDQPKNGTTKYAVSVRGVVLPQFILAKSDAEFDTLWNGFMADHKAALCFDRLFAFQNARYQDHKKKLGLTQRPRQSRR